jgi:phage shock protein PspC (stress-responsive transcriptional regulator)
MNKTVNINLAGIFFHVDEDAYNVLKNYLDTIKMSFKNTEGSLEIIADIEARIAELFSELLQSKAEVISLKEVDEVIAIMGQPEDYLDEEALNEEQPSFDTQSSTNTNKKLYRDVNDRYISGVCSGIGHYVGLDSLWVRLLFILLLFISAGTIVPVYIILWVLVPEAITTADKLRMIGQPINVSNIEKKIKDGFSSVSDGVKQVDFKKHGNQIKSSSKTVVDGLIKALSVGLTLFGKFIGLILIIVSISMFIGLISFVLSINIIDFINLPLSNEIQLTTNIPAWLLSILVAVSFGIPIFLLFYLGLKVIMSNLKSIGRVAKLTLLGLWICSLIGWMIYGVKQFSEFSHDSKIDQYETLYTTSDKLYVKMIPHYFIDKELHRDNDIDLEYDEEGNRIIYSQNIRLVVKSTKESSPYMVIEKNASGKTYQMAKSRATNINYDWELTPNDELLLNGYFTSTPDQLNRGQHIEITLFMPEGMTIYAYDNTYSYHRNTSGYGDILDNGKEEKYLKVLNNELQCLDCEIDDSIEFETSLNSKFKINKNGINAESDQVNVEISSNGISIKQKNN